MTKKLKIIIIHQPNYLPWLGFFHKIMVSDIFVILDDVQFEKNGYNNRNKIKTANGEMWLTVPIIRKGKPKSTTINNSLIDNTQKWKEKHLKSIKLNYSKAPFYKKYIGFFEEVYSKEWTNLSELNIYIINWILKELSIKTKVVISSEIDGKKGEKDDLILDICKRLKGDIYVSGTLGRDYIQNWKFAKEKIFVYFQEYVHPEYNQMYGDFRFYMSIIDLMFNYGAKSKEIIMQRNISREQIINRRLENEK